jgi:hypothetical protein
MTRTDPKDWSPADNPYAIAVSESQWWREAARLAILRMRDPDDRRLAWMSSRQIDARHLIVALRQLLTAARLERLALEEHGVAAEVISALDSAEQQFVDALPGIKDMRDALTHFDEWSRGLGRGPQKARRAAGELPRDIAKEFWGFGFNPTTAIVTFGPHEIHIDTAEKEAIELCQAIYLAAREVDKKHTAERRTRVVDALTAADIEFNTPGSALKVSPGADLKIWISLDLTANVQHAARGELAARVSVALATAGLELVSSMFPDATDTSERLASGEAVYADGRS